MNSKTHHPKANGSADRARRRQAREDAAWYAKHRCTRRQSLSRNFGGQVAEWARRNADTLVVRTLSPAELRRLRAS